MSIARIVHFSLALSLLLAGLAGCSDERKATTPRLSVEPAAFVFPKLQPGEVLRRRVALANRGSAELLVRNVRLVDESSDGEFTLTYEGPDGAVGPLPDLIRIPVGGNTPALIVEYAPVEEADSANPIVDQGSVRLESNDPDNLEAQIEIIAGGQGAELLVQPNIIRFEEVEAGGESEQVVRLSNVGLADLVITELRVDGSQDFSAALDGRRLNGDLGDAPIVIAPDTTVEVQMVYAPPSLGQDLGELVILSNNVQAEEVRVPIEARGLAPCINAYPTPLDFGSALLVPSREGETPNLKALTIESCGDVELRVERIEFEGEAFGLARPIQPANPDGPLIRLPAQVPGGEPPTEVLSVGFWPVEEQAYGGRLLLYTNVQAEPIAVDLFGRGVENSCPIPDVVTEAYDVRPLDIIDLDGSPSTDPGGRVERWAWTVVDRPSGSVSRIVERFENPREPADGGEADDESTPLARFFVDLAGEYTVELQVYDNLGQVSCDPIAVKRVRVTAVPDRDLHVQLVWSTPDDPDETDGIGTDVDLHLRHESAMDRWGAAADPWDCFFNNKTPDWGVPGDLADDPSLDIDDTNGAGPENINLSNPEIGTSYDVAAIYFRAESTFGDPEVDPRTEHPSYVTVRIYVRGDVLYEAIDREMTAVSQLWHVARVRWCEDGPACPAIEEVDRVLEADEWFRP
ncbi:MAG: hypothetical protein KC613_25975 [Myxococcales bacterium]|nr:hypothetical protein [Myxococcales bacterium]MCB9521823.1 hypothetical protein [Myxococcales bacterium]